MMPTDPATLAVRHDPERNSFTVESGPLVVGRLTYSHAGGASISIDHVVVRPEARGGRIARVLVERACLWAEQQHLRVVPVCRYAQVVVARAAERKGQVDGKLRG